MDSDFEDSEDNAISVELDTSSTSDSSLADLGDRGSSEGSVFADKVNIRAVTDESRDSINLAEDSPSRPFPPTALVIRLNPKIGPLAVAFFIQKVKSPKREGGAELLVRSEPFSISKPGELFVLHITADTLRYLEVAEYLGLKKLDSRGQIREFIVKEMESFLINGMSIESLITPAEKIFIVLHELQLVNALPGEEFIPTKPEMPIHTGQSIFQVYVLEKYIHSYYPLHDPDELEIFGRHNWFNAFWDPTLFNDVRRYFGDSITMFFAFSTFYTKILVIPAILSFLLFLLPSWNMFIVFFSIFNLTYTSIVLKLWRRKCSKMAYFWGTLDLNKWDVEPRLLYTGDIAVDPVTGHFRPRYAWWKTAAKFYTVLIVCVGGCMGIAVYLCILYFNFNDTIRAYKESLGRSCLGIIFGFIPSTMYAVLVSLLTALYRRMMRSLTDWENHRTQSQFDKKLVIKLVLFESVNNFACYFYVAFIISDVKSLQKQLLTVLVVLHLLNAFQEIVLPIFLKKTASTVQLFLSTTHRSRAGMGLDQYILSTHDLMHLEWNHNVLGVFQLDPDDQRIAMAFVEGKMIPYGDCFDDYQQLFIQFGYAFLFSPVVPGGVCIALISNFFVIWANIYKLCRVYQRPIPKRVKDIGAWQSSFEFISGLSVITNIALIVIVFEIRKWPLFAEMTDFHFFILIASLEHLIIFLKLSFYYGVSNVPHKISLARSKTEYQAREAFKKEQQMKSRRRLTMRFQAINLNLRDAEEEQGTPTTYL